MIPQIVKNTIDGLVSDFLYYDRKEDEELPLGEIEQLIQLETMSIDEIVSEFRTVLVRGLS